MATRTFLALPTDEAIVQRLVDAQGALSAAGAKVRWVARANLHMTVKFLGDVGDDQLADVCDLARRTAGQVEPFDYAIRRLSAVPPTGALRMVWAGVDDPAGRLEWLNAMIEDAYAGMGFKMENRRFRPHLTLGRVKGARNVGRLRDAVGRFAAADFGTQSATELIVFASELTRDGPIYSALATAPLGGA